MGTLAAGIKEIFATAKTTGSNVMLCGDDGTPDGHMTMANLASVLGGTFYIHNESNTDFDDYHTGGVYRMYNCTNSPDGDYMVLIVFGYNSDEVVQQAFNIVSGKCYVRVYVNGLWWQWMEVSTDVPSFYKNYNDLSSLASALGVNKKVVAVAEQGNTVTETIPYRAFIFVRDGFYDSYGALWYVHGSTMVKIMEESDSVLSATNTSALCFVSFGNNVMTVKNNNNGAITITYMYLNLD